MTNSSYRYPADEFDVAVPGGAPVGVHRAPRSGWSSAWPFLLVALVCAGVAWGGITLLSGGGGGSPAAEPTASASAGASSAPSGGGEGGASKSPKPKAPSPEELVAQMDPTAAYLVFNVGATVDQLAATTVTNLEAAGVANASFSTESTPAAGDTSTLSANTIWYGDGREKEAKALAAVLGIPQSNVVVNQAVTESSEAAWVLMFTAPAN